jgi:hypothetical protein
MRILSLLLFVGALFISSCTKKSVSEGELVGSYTYTSPTLGGSLEINPDHTFRGVATGSHESLGKWVFVPPQEGESGYGTVKLDVNILKDSSGKILQEDVEFDITLYVHLKSEKIHLWANPDGSAFYSKL